MSQPHPPPLAALLKKARLELEAAKQRIVSLEMELARLRATDIKRGFAAAASPPDAGGTDSTPEPASAAGEAEAISKPIESSAVTQPSVEEAGKAADASAMEAAPEKKGESDTDSALAGMERERDRYLEMAQRAQADLENYRRRTRKEFAELKRESLSGFLKEFFPAFDDLDRVIAAAEKDSAAATFREGVALARANLWRTMEKSGVTAIEASGDAFDPRVHEVIAAVPGGDKPDGSILEVFQSGYRLDDFVLRPAKVVVAKKA